MLRIITDAPLFVVREALSLVPGAQVIDAYDIDAPSWAEALIVAPQTDALALGLARLGAFRFDRFAPRVARGDPTFAMAMAAIDGPEYPASGALPAVRCAY